MSQYHFVMIAPSDNIPMSLPSSHVSFVSREHLAKVKEVQGASGAWKVNIHKKMVNNGANFAQKAGTHRRETVRHASFVLVDGFHHFSLILTVVSLRETANVVPAS